MMSSGFFVQSFKLMNFVALVVAACFAQTQQSPAANVVVTAAPKGTVLYSFTGGFDGADPHSGLIFDGGGALYGTTAFGGTLNAGTVFKLAPPAKGGTQWSRTLLHGFSSAPDGVQPYAGVIFDGSGALYGTTTFGGNPAFGTVYKLTPPATGGGTLWTETVLYSFTGGLMVVIRLTLER
jgi:uncharacterized repeat protein (TIGR03803 family)